MKQVKKEGKSKVILPDEKNNHRALNIAVRYIILLAVAIPNLYLFYMVFTPLTIYPVYWLLNMLFNVSLSANQILLLTEGNQALVISIIKACIAGSAYYLLLILNLATPNIKIKKRLALIAGSFLVFLILNILRIFILVLVYLTGTNLFDAIHLVFWYGISIAFVILIWFLEVKAFKLKEIPFFADVKFLYSQTKSTSKKK